ncbi:hypothetical protein AMJ85_11120 [candidate division BRC1 bacterium SM23_51]|nr:MAG: hypothetical protein AMJ85_11120 [candidate division BRC1 bacterium SM23_51]
MKFALETILEAESDVREAYRMIQAAGMTEMSEVRESLLREAVLRLVNSAGELGANLSQAAGVTEPTPRGFIVRRSKLAQHLGVAA